MRTQREDSRLHAEERDLRRNTPVDTLISDFQLPGWAKLIFVVSADRPPLRLVMTVPEEQHSHPVESSISQMGILRSREGRVSSSLLNRALSTRQMVFSHRTVPPLPS